MYRHWHKLHSRLHNIFFGTAYRPANHEALSPHGSTAGIRLVIISVGTIWLSFVLFDNLARPWQRHPKSWRYFQGPRELNEIPNLPKQLDLSRTNGSMGSDIGVTSLVEPYIQSEDTTRVFLETDANGFRTSHLTKSLSAILCGDSFSNNNSWADSLSKTTGLAVGNRAIEGRGTLTMARFLESTDSSEHHIPIVLWESTQRAAVGDFRSLPIKRAQLHRSFRQQFEWRSSLFFPNNIDIYLNGSSLLKKVLDRMEKEIKWVLLKKYTPLFILGRQDLPINKAPMLYLAADEGIRPEITNQAQLDSIADYITAVDRELRQRKQHLIFMVAPEKSVVYPDRLPAGVTTHSLYIKGLNQALRERGVYVVNLLPGLYHAAQTDSTHLYYYTADTHWTPRGMAVASHIVADSLRAWKLLPEAGRH